MRVTLEAEALRLSVPQMTSEDIARLEGYMAEMAHYAEREGLPALDRPAPQLSPRADRARGRAGQLRARARCSTTPSATAACTSARARARGRPPQHRDILDACKAGDRERSARPAGRPPGPDRASRSPSCSSPAIDPSALRAARARRRRRAAQAARDQEGQALSRPPPSPAEAGAPQTVRLNWRTRLVELVGVARQCLRAGAAISCGRPRSAALTPRPARSRPRTARRRRRPR